MARALEDHFDCQRYRLSGDGWTLADEVELKPGSYGWERRHSSDHYFADVDVTYPDDRVGYVMTMYVARALGLTDPGELVSIALDDTD